MNRVMYFMFVLAVLFLIACTGQEKITYETVASASIKVGSPIPSPSEKVVLTLSGSITIKNTEDSLVFDLPTLEKLGLVEYTVTDPWLNTEVVYTGVLLAELLKYAGVPDSAAAVRVIALDGYADDIPLEILEEWPVLLATQANGDYMTIETNGPTRVIFPYDTYTDLAEARNMSVWNVESIEVR